MLVTVRSVTKRQTRQRRAMVTAQVGDESGRLSRGVLQPAVAGAPAHARACRSRCSASPTSYRGTLQMTNPVVDLIGDRTGRIVPIYPQSEKVGHPHLGAGRAASSRPCAAASAAGWPTRCPAGCGGGSGWSIGRPRCSASTCPSRWPTRSGPAAGWPSTSCSGSSSCSCCASGRSSGTPSASATRSAASWCGGSTTGLPFPLTGAQAPRHRRDRGRPGRRRTRCTASCRATWAAARPWWR